MSNSDKYRVDFIGDCGIQIRFVSTAGINLTEIKKRINNLEKIKDLYFAFDTISIFFDPIVTNPFILKEKVLNIISAGDFTTEKGVKNEDENKVIEIPVCFCEVCALDRERAIKFSGLSFKDFVEQYVSVEYKVLFIGFQPGFPFLGGLPENLHIPRLATPRTRIEGGSVGIGGSQTGIYPFASAGGWNIIGKTNVKLFDFHKGALLKPGDKVKFAIQNHTLQ